MTESQALTWAILKNDFTVLLDHVSLPRISTLVGQYCSTQDEPVCNQVCGDVMARIMHTEDRPEVLCRVAYEWLNTYQLPLNMARHTVWDDFHETCASWIQDKMGKTVKEYLADFDDPSYASLR